MFVLVFIILGLIVAVLHIYRDRQRLTRRRVVEILLLWFLVVPAGIGGLFAFIGHTVFAAQMAASIDWPAGNPFQTEVAVADLALGILGILCYWIRGSFWIAAVVSTSVFLLGAAAIHIQQIVSAQNYSPDNAGTILYTDVALPLILIALLSYYEFLGKHERVSAARKQPL